MWKESIVASRYDQLPALASPSVFDPLKLTTSSFSVKALTAAGDELEHGRHKLIGCNSHTDDTRYAFIGTTFSGKETSRRYSAETSFHAASKRSL